MGGATFLLPTPPPQPAPLLSQGKQGQLAGGSHPMATVAPQGTEPTGWDPFPETCVQCGGHTQAFAHHPAF